MHPHEIADYECIWYPKKKNNANKTKEWMNERMNAVYPKPYQTASICNVIICNKVSNANNIQSALTT